MPIKGRTIFGGALPRFQAAKKFESPS